MDRFDMTRYAHAVMTLMNKLDIDEAVIGGTSLFGGRGKPRDAILGALVIVMIPNGIGLKPNLGVQYQEIITGAVLLIAASVDAISRRRALPTH